MIRNNREDEDTGKSVWVERPEQTSSQCYSNLSVYGTNYGTNRTHSYTNQEYVNGGIVKKIQVPYPAEPVPQIMQALGLPHKYDSGYK